MRLGRAKDCRKVSHSASSVTLQSDDSGPDIIAIFAVMASLARFQLGLCTCMYAQYSGSTRAQSGVKACRAYPARMVLGMGQNVTLEEFGAT
jgi:hypothetical protein